MRSVLPKQTELYYMRMLLCHRTGCQSFEDIRTINGKTMDTFRAAAIELGIADDEREWFLCLEEVLY